VYRVYRALFTGLQATLPSALLLVGIAPMGFGDGSAHAQTSKPNVVLFVVDDMGWADWQRDAARNPTGSPVYETPNLLQLAQSGVNFSSGAYASSPVCSPTRTALLTGKTPARTRVTEYIPGSGYATATLREPAWTKNLPTSEVTLAESLQSAGYTAGHFGKWHLGTPGNPGINPLQHGYAVNVGGTDAGGIGCCGGNFAGSDGMWAGLPGLNTPGEFPAGKYITDALTDRANDFIGQRAATGPFFLTMWHYGVHIPIQAPADLVAKYQVKIGTLQGQGVDLRGHTNATYAAMIESIDQSLGRMMNRLADPNQDGDNSDSIRDNTIVIFTSDNGGVWGADGSPTDNRPLREGKGSIYEGGIRVPLIVNWTGNSNITPGTNTAARTSLYDLYPTLLDLAGLQADPTVVRNGDMDGVSIRSALEGGAFDRGYLYWHYPHFSPQDRNSSLINGGSFVSAVSDNRWKLIFRYNERSYELYDLANDVGETTNVLGQNAGVAHALSLTLRDYLAGVSAQMPIEIATGQPVALPPVLAAPPMSSVPPGSTVMRIDFGINTQTTNLTGWNNVTGASGAEPVVALPLSDIAGNATGVILRTQWSQMSDDTGISGTAANFDGPYPSPSLDDLPASALRDSVYVRDGQKLSLTLEGLDTLATYQFLFYGAAGNTGDYSLFTITGSTTAQAHISPLVNNSSQIAVVNGMMATASGTILIDFEGRRADGSPQLPGVDNDGTGRLNYLQIAQQLLELPGDFNHDRVVDAADYAVWRASFGATGDRDADANGNGIVDAADYTVWRNNFGRSARPAGGGGSGQILSSQLSLSAVPEPAAWSLALLGWVVSVKLGLARRRCHSCCGRACSAGA